MSRDTLSPREIAARTGLSYHAVLRAIHRGELHAAPVCDGARLLVTVEEYERWIAPRPLESSQPAKNIPRRSPRRAAARGSVAALKAIEGGA